MGYPPAVVRAALSPGRVGTGDRQTPALIFRWHSTALKRSLQHTGQVFGSPLNPELRPNAMSPDVDF